MNMKISMDSPRNDNEVWFPRQAAAAQCPSVRGSFARRPPSSCPGTCSASLDWENCNPGNGFLCHQHLFWPSLESCWKSPGSEGRCSCQWDSQRRDLQDLHKRPTGRLGLSLQQYFLLPSFCVLPKWRVSLIVVSCQIRWIKWFAEIWSMLNIHVKRQRPVMGQATSLTADSP